MDTEIQTQIDDMMSQIKSLKDLVSELEDRLSNHKHRGFDKTQRLSFSSLVDVTSDYTAFPSYYIRVTTDGKGLRYSAT